MTDPIPTAPSIYEHTAHDWVQCVCPQCQRVATLMDDRARLTAERDEAARLSHQFRDERDAALRERDEARAALVLAGVVADLAEAQQVRAALDAKPSRGVLMYTIDPKEGQRGAPHAERTEIDRLTGDLDRAHREIRRLLAERAAAVMERDRARADLDARLVDHLRTDAEHRAEIDRLREQVARLVGG